MAVMVEMEAIAALPLEDREEMGATAALGKGEMAGTEAVVCRAKAGMVEMGAMDQQVAVKEAREAKVPPETEVMDKTAGKNNSGFSMKNTFILATFLSLACALSISISADDTETTNPPNSTRAQDGAHGENGRQYINGQNGQDGQNGQQDQDGGHGGNGGNSDWGNGGDGGNGGDAE